MPPVIPRTLRKVNANILEFLQSGGIAADTVTISPPAITDRLAQLSGDGPAVELRYTAQQTLTVSSPDISSVCLLMSGMSELCREGIVFSGAECGLQPEYIFSRLNDIKPAMIEQASRKARGAAEKFAADSQSTLGTIRAARLIHQCIDSADSAHIHTRRTDLWVIGAVRRHINLLGSLLSA